MRNKKTRKSEICISPKSKIDTKTYCICRSSTCDTFMIACDKCQEWYHGTCIGISEKKSKNILSYFCQICIENDPKLEITYKKPADSGLKSPVGNLSIRKKRSLSLIDTNLNLDKQKPDKDTNTRNSLESLEKQSRIHNRIFSDTFDPNFINSTFLKQCCAMTCSNTAIVSRFCSIKCKEKSEGYGLNTQLYGVRRANNVPDNFVPYNLPYSDHLYCRYHRFQGIKSPQTNVENNQSLFYQDPLSCIPPSVTPSVFQPNSIYQIKYQPNREDSQENKQKDQYKPEDKISQKTETNISHFNEDTEKDQPQRIKTINSVTSEPFILTNLPPHIIENAPQDSTKGPTCAKTNQEYYTISENENIEINWPSPSNSQNISLT